MWRVVPQETASERLETGTWPHLLLRWESGWSHHRWINTQQLRSSSGMWAPYLQPGEGSDTGSNSPEVGGCSPWETGLVQGSKAGQLLSPEFHCVWHQQNLLRSSSVKSLRLCLQGEGKIVSVANFLFQGSFYWGHKSWWVTYVPWVEITNCIHSEPMHYFFPKVFWRAGWSLTNFFFFF